MTTKNDKSTEGDAPKAPPIFARYVGGGSQFFVGVPAKDLTKEEFDSLEPLSQRDVLAGTIFNVSADASGSENK